MGRREEIVSKSCMREGRRGGRREEEGREKKVERGGGKEGVGRERREEKGKRVEMRGKGEYKILNEGNKENEGNEGNEGNESEGAMLYQDETTRRPLPLCKVLSGSAGLTCYGHWPSRACEGLRKAGILHLYDDIDVRYQS